MSCDLSVAAEWKWENFKSHPVRWWTWFLAGKPAWRCRQAERRWEIVIDDYLSSDTLFLPFFRQRPGGLGRSHHFAAITTAGLSGCCAEVGSIMSFFLGRLQEQVQVLQSLGCQDATYLHYLIWDCSPTSSLSLTVLLSSVKNVVKKKTTFFIILNLWNDMRIF